MSPTWFFFLKSCFGDSTPLPFYTDFRLDNVCIYWDLGRNCINCPHQSGTELVAGNRTPLSVPFFEHIYA